MILQASLDGTANAPRGAVVKPRIVAGGAETDRGAPKPGAARDMMQLDTWFDLAVWELSELTDHAREMRDEAEKAAPTASTPMADEDEGPAVPPAAAA